jgi:hypothetical protein
MNLNKGTPTHGRRKKKKKGDKKRKGKKGMEIKKWHFYLERCTGEKVVEI